VAKQKLIAAKEQSKRHFDEKAKEVQINIGDKVLLYDETVCRDRSKKLSNQWIGPCEVIGIEKVNVIIKKGHRV
jgi:hypothetical protein